MKPLGDVDDSRICVKLTFIRFCCCATGCGCAFLTSHSRPPTFCFGSLTAASALSSVSKMMKQNSRRRPRVRSNGSSTPSILPYREKYARMSSSLKFASTPPTKIFLQMGRDFARFGSICLSRTMCTGLLNTCAMRNVNHRSTCQPRTNLVDGRLVSKRDEAEASRCAGDRVDFDRHVLDLSELTEVVAQIICGDVW